MTTQKQIEANRRNSSKSTGPKTRTGKAESKMNSMKHGLLAEQVVVRDEDPAEFTRVLETLVNELQPRGPLEEQLVERLAACMWRLRRLYRVEAGVYALESIRVELSHNLDEMNKYEEMRQLVNYPTDKILHITDKQKHGKALAQVEKTTKVLRGMSNSLGAAFVFDAENVGAISKLSRYEAAIERSLYRALHELQRVQTARQGGIPPPSIAVDLTVDGPGPAPDSDE
jgi:hypothetical protein